MTRCSICRRRPAYNGTSRCQQCGGHVKRLGRRQQVKPLKPSCYMVYHDDVCGLFELGEDATSGQDAFVLILLRLKPDKVPKAAHTIRLDRFCAGYPRDQFKKLKALFRGSVGRGVRPVPTTDDLRGPVKPIAWPTDPPPPPDKGPLYEPIGVVHRGKRRFRVFLN